MRWLLVHPAVTEEVLGWLPSFLSEDDPRSAREQLDANYKYGGGWDPILITDQGLEFPDDPPQPLLAETLRSIENGLIHTPSAQAS